MKYTERIYELAKLAAEQAHFGISYDIFPYTKHLSDVVEVLKEWGYSGKYIVAAWLHDSIEDGNISYSKIKKAFGEEVAEIVYAVTDEGRTRKEKKRNTYMKLVKNPDAIIVKLADRIANVEHSIEYNNRDKFKMYQEEFEDFQKHLKINDKAIPMWNYLESLMDKEKH